MDADRGCSSEFKSGDFDAGDSRQYEEMDLLLITFCVIMIS